MKKIVVVALSALAFASAARAQTKVLMMVPDDFMWPEYAEPRKLYERAGFKVATAGKRREARRPDRRNARDYPESRPVKVDLAFDEVDLDSFDAITFVAGNGAWHDFFPNQTVHDLVIEAFAKRKVVGLLCASTGLLGLVGNWDGSRPIASGRRVVGYFRVEGLLRRLGKVEFLPGGRTEPAVAVDGDLVTGRNPESSRIFGEKIVEVLKRRSASER